MNLKPLFTNLLIIVKSIVNGFGKFLCHFDSGNVASCPVMFLDWRWGLSDNHYFVYVLIIYFIVGIIIPANKQTNTSLPQSVQTQKHGPVLSDRPLLMNFIYYSHVGHFGVAQGTEESFKF